MLATTTVSQSSLKVTEHFTGNFTMAGHPSKRELNPRQPVKALIFGLMGTCLDWHSAVSPVLLKAFSIPEGEKPPFTATKWRHECLDGCYDSSETGFPQEDVDYTRRRVLLDMVQSHRVEMDGVEVEACVKAWHEQIGMVFVIFFSDLFGTCCKAGR
jgi:hypothetical protein